MTELKKWAKDNGYTRPFKSLVAMPPEFRTNILETLKITLSSGIVGDPEKEAKTIIDSDLYGIVARLHSRIQQLNPFGSNLTWREVLISIVEKHLELPFPAHSSEEDLEMLFLQNILRRRIKAKKGRSLPIPPITTKVIPSQAGIFIDIIKNIDNLIDDLIGSGDAPAVHAVISICLYLHPEFIASK